MHEMINQGENNPDKVQKENALLEYTLDKYGIDQDSIDVLGSGEFNSPRDSSQKISSSHGESRSGEDPEERDTVLPITLPKQSAVQIKNTMTKHPTMALPRKTLNYNDKAQTMRHQSTLMSNSNLDFDSNPFN